MFQNFRLSMAWVHTWFGLVLGYVLMVCFFFGSLAVFDREIDRWAMPSTRVEKQPIPSFDRVLQPLLAKVQPGPDDIAWMKDRVNVPLPGRYDVVNYWDVWTSRDPILHLYAGFEVANAKEKGDLIYGSQALRPDGTPLPKDSAFLGTGFFYPMHFNLTLEWKELGAWIVGFAALMMMAALVSGVVMHRKIFREFFTFRPRKATQRSTLDLHNLTGVVALPFHFFFAFTGLAIFVGIYFPVGHTQLHDLHELHEKKEAKERVGLAKERAGVPAPAASVDAMVAEAQRRWASRGLGNDVLALTLIHVGDANGYVIVRRATDDRMTEVAGNNIYFKATTGEVVRESPGPTAMANTTSFLHGLHLIGFKHWGLRWIYVFGGLVGCVCIATGFIFFVEKRKKQHAKEGGQGSRIVDALAVTCVTGMVIATLAILIANRVIPETLPAGWPERNSLQRWGFWAAWVVAMAHAFVRSTPVARAETNPAWREQCWAIAGLAILAVLLNWATTGDHLVKTLSAAYWPVAGFDLSLLATAIVAALAARRLARRRDNADAPALEPADA